MKLLHFSIIASICLLSYSFRMKAPVVQKGGSFSCKINGKLFTSGGGTDGFVNSAFKTSPDHITFSLVSIDPSFKGKIPAQFSFRISSKGTCHFNAGDVHSSCSAKYSPADYPDAYNAQSGTCTITSIKADHITGTFSGTFSGMEKTFEVTEGKFDLPASSYSKPLL